MVALALPGRTAALAVNDADAFQGKVRINGRIFKLYHRKGGKWWARADTWGRHGLVATGAKTKAYLLSRLDEWPRR